MKKLIIVFLTYSVSFFVNSQKANRYLIHDAIDFSDSLTANSVSKELFDNNFKIDFEKSSLSYSFIDSTYKDIVTKEFSLNEYFKLENDFNSIHLVYIINDNNKNRIGYSKHNFTVKNGEIYSSYNYSTKGLKKYYKTYLRVIKGRYLSYEEAKKIVEKKGFHDILIYELIDDKKWSFNNEMKKEKPTWTFKEQYIDDKNKLNGYRVIKINARNGKVVSEFIEHPID